MAFPPDLHEALSDSAAHKALLALDQRGELTRLLPELEAGRGFKQPELHYYDVLDHNLAAVAALDAVLGDGPDGRELRASVVWIDIDGTLEGQIDGIKLLVLVRLGALLHDVAKPATATLEDGRLRFPRHGPCGAEMMKERLPQLGLGENATLLVTRLIRYHLRPGELIRNWPVSDRAVRKFVADLEGQVLPLLLVNLADGMATQGPRYTREHYRRHCAFINYVAARAWGASEVGEPPLVSGDDLIAELDLPGGRLLGAVLTSVRRAQLEGAISERPEALALARSVLESLQAGSNGQAPEQEIPPMTAMWQVIFYTGSAVIAFYFFLLRPVLQDQKERRKAVRQLQVGDEIVTTGGIIGEVKDVVVPADGPTELIIEIAPGVRVRAVTDSVLRRLSTLEPHEGAAAPPEASPNEVSPTSA